MLENFLEIDVVNLEYVKSNRHNDMGANMEAPKLYGIESEPTVAQRQLLIRSDMIP